MIHRANGALSGDPSKRPAGISDAEMERRLAALKAAKAREVEEAAQREAEEKAREEERERRRLELEAKEREEREREERGSVLLKELRLAAGMQVADIGAGTGWYARRMAPMVAPGRVPLRRADNDLAGQAPAPGWDARYDWIGWVPAGEVWGAGGPTPCRRRED